MTHPTPSMTRSMAYDAARRALTRTSTENRGGGERIRAIILQTEISLHYPGRN